MNERYESFSERICDGTVNKGIDVSVNKTVSKGTDVLVNEAVVEL